MAIPLRPVQKTEPSSLHVLSFFFFSLWDEGWGLGVAWLEQAVLCMALFKKAFVVTNVSRPTFVLDCIESVVWPLRIGQYTCKIPLWQR